MLKRIIRFFNNISKRIQEKEEHEHNFKKRLDERDREMIMFGLQKASIAFESIKCEIDYLGIKIWRDFAFDENYFESTEGLNLLRLNRMRKYYEEDSHIRNPESPMSYRIGVMSEINQCRNLNNENWRDMYCKNIVDPILSELISEIKRNYKNQYQRDIEAKEKLEAKLSKNCEESNLYYSKMNKKQFEAELKSEGWTSLGNKNHCPKCNGIKEEV